VEFFSKISTMPTAADPDIPPIFLSQSQLEASQGYIILFGVSISIFFALVLAFAIMQPPFSLIPVSEEEKSKVLIVLNRND
jgi:hypothetical protein